MAVAVFVRNLRIDAERRSPKLNVLAIVETFIHSKMRVYCKAQILHRLFEKNLSITNSD